MLDHENSVVAQQWHASQNLQCVSVQVFTVIRWIQKRDVECETVSVEVSGSFGEFHFEQSKPGAHTQSCKILSDDRSRLSRRIDEGHIMGSAADGLDPDSARPRKRIEKTRS